MSDFRLRCTVLLVSGVNRSSQDGSSTALVCSSDVESAVCRLQNLLRERASIVSQNSQEPLYWMAKPCFPLDFPSKIPPLIVAAMAFILFFFLQAVLAVLADGRAYRARVVAANPVVPKSCADKCAVRWG